MASAPPQGACVIIRRARCTVALLTTVSVIIGLPAAFANGDIFFHLDVFDVSDTPIEEQVVYAGNVKDAGGNYLADATITVSVTIVTSRGDKRISYNAYTNVVGRYRTLDVASVILALEEQEYEFELSNIDVTVEKKGYEIIRRLDRSRRSQTGGVFEVNFVMAHSDQNGN